jgi:UDP-N-acetylglucosamine 3-dehydrogenase
MSPSKLRVGMIGTGNFGPILAQFFQESAEVVAICDPSAESRARFVKSTGLRVAEYGDYQELLASKGIDAVALTGPNFTHAPIAVAAAETGKHVFCEKAMATTVPDCWKMVRACERAKVKLMVGHKRRLRPAWAKMITMSKQLGGIAAMSIVGYFDARPDDFKGWWVQQSLSGGVLMLSGVHEVDWMRALCGDVDAVSAISGPQVDQRYDFADSIHVQLKFRSGAIGFLGVSLSYPLRRYRQVYGAEATCRNGGVRLVSSFKEADLYWKSLDDKEEHHEHYEEASGDPVGANEALRKETSDFVRWVVDGTEPCLTWREGLRAVEVIEAARHSAAENGAWIKLPLYRELENQ